MAWPSKHQNCLLLVPLLVRARALVHVSPEPVKVLTHLAAVPRAVDARNARVSTAAAISERMRR